MADIVITEFMDATAVADLSKTHDVFHEADLVDRPGDLVREAAGARALIVRNRTRVTAELLDQCPDLKVIGRLGVGLENIDLEACAARNVEVCPARGANAVSVAEYVIGTLLALLRFTHAATGRVVAGDWPRNEFMGREASGRTLGLVGFGDIARQAASRARALGMTVVAHDPFLADDDPVWRALNATPMALDQLLAAADAVSLHIPFTPATKDMIDAAAIASMKDDAILINTARGGIVDEAALVAALKGGKLGGAAIDVFAAEPVDTGSGARFRDVPNLILTPHIAGVTHEANRRISSVTVENVLRVLDD